ncbi:MAG: cytochrome c [Gemmatimonadetes bacterium]|nr:cytochrome c [Gemmatimonadota bacterium]
MRSLPRLIALLVLAGAAAAPVSAQEPDPAPARSAMDGVYTVEQASRGSATFEEECSLCHETADFAGDVFEARWTGRPAHALFSFMRDSLAHGEIRPLDPEEHADLLAYIFQLNGFPAAATELAAEETALQAIEMAAPTGQPAEVLAPTTTPADPGAPAAPVGPLRSAALGVYTDGQADRGEAAWSATCAACHETTDFHDDAFVEGWNGRPVSDLFRFVRENMPDDAPGSLPDQEYADILAYVLRLNGLPPAGLPLPADDAVLSQLRLDLDGDPPGGR